MEKTGWAVTQNYRTCGTHEQVSGKRLELVSFPFPPFVQYNGDMKAQTRRLYPFIFILSMLLLAGCNAPATPQTPAATASAPAITPAPQASPLPPEQQALLDERDSVAQDLFSTLEKARVRGATEEEIGDITRTYVATIEAIESQLRQANASFQPLNLPPTPTLVAKKDVFDIGMVTEDGVRIKGTYYRPAAANAPGIVLLHMLGRHREDWDAFARTLQDAGYAVLAIDLRGHGESEGQREWSKMTKDAAIAVDFVRSRSETDPDRIALIGASIGANLAINYAAEDPEIRGVALLSPGLDYRGVTTPEAVKAYGKRPLFLAASSEDRYAYGSAQELGRLATGPVQLLLLDGQGHGTQMLGKDNGLEEALLNWLREGAFGDAQT